MSQRGWMRSASCSQEASSRKFSNASQASYLRGIRTLASVMLWVAKQVFNTIQLDRSRGFAFSRRIASAETPVRVR